MILRDWQKTAFPLIMEAWQREENGILRAATGSGKGRVIALTAKHTKLGIRGKTVISVPTIPLIFQMKKELTALGVRASLYYSKEKDITNNVIVVCLPSLGQLSESLAKRRFDIENWIADECHRTETPLVKEFALRYPNAWRLGFTATPHRASSRESLSLYDKMIFEYTAEQALRDGVIVPPDIMPFVGKKETLDDVCIEQISSPSLRGLAGLVSAWTINDAIFFAQKLNVRGIRAAPIFGEQPDFVQKKLIEALKYKKLDCLVHVNLLTEGADLPFLRWLCMRRTSKNVVRSRNRFIQEVGRVLRCDPASGKTKAIILDPHDLFNRLRLTYDAVIGQEIEWEGEGEGEGEGEMDESVNRDEREEKGERAFPIPFEDRPIADSLHIRQPLRSLALNLRLKGIVPPSDPSLRRGAMPSFQQKMEVRKSLLQAAHLEKDLPHNFRAMISHYAQRWIGDHLSAGDVEDLHSILIALARGWRPL